MATPEEIKAQEEAAAAEAAKKVNVPKAGEESKILDMDVEELAKMDEHLAENPEEVEEKPLEGVQKSEEELAAAEAAKVAEEKEAIKKEEDDPKDKQLKDQKAEITRLQQDAVKREKQESDGKWKGYKPLTNEEKEELLDDDNKEAYKIAIEQESEYNEYLKDKSHQQITDANIENRDVVLNFLARMKGTDLNDAARAEILKTLEKEDSPETKLILEVDEYLGKNFKPVRQVKVGEDQFLPVYSKEQIESAYKILHHEDIVNAKVETTKKEVTQTLEKLGKSGSIFDRVETSPGEETKMKKAQEYSQNDVENMDPKQLEILSKELDQELE